MNFVVMEEEQVMSFKFVFGHSGTPCDVLPLLTNIRNCGILWLVKHCFTAVGTQTCGLASSMRASTPGKPGLTSRAKGVVSSTITLKARRAGCVERRSSGSREAAVSKAHQESIYSFYPMGWAEWGRPGQTELQLSRGTQRGEADSVG
jgi:hypothetical protein